MSLKLNICLLGTFFSSFTSAASAHCSWSNHFLHALLLLVNAHNLRVDDLELAICKAVISRPHPSPFFSCIRLDARAKLHYMSKPFELQSPSHSSETTKLVISPFAAITIGYCQMQLWHKIYGCQLCD